MKRNLPAALGAIIVMVIAFAVLSGGNQPSDDPSGTITATDVSTGQQLDGGTEQNDAESDDDVADAPPEADEQDAEAPAGFSDLPTIEPGELPDEAIVTLQLIAVGGPYPYRQDDGVFQNREGILPDRPQGHYREYTVDTPGSDDRGARRIVSGADGELYYTDDHYDSFREVITR